MRAPAPGAGIRSPEPTACERLARRIVRPACGTRPPPFRVARAHGLAASPRAPAPGRTDETLVARSRASGGKSLDYLKTANPTEDRGARLDVSSDRGHSALRTECLREIATRNSFMDNRYFEGCSRPGEGVRARSAGIRLG